MFFIFKENLFRGKLQKWIVVFGETRSPFIIALDGSVILSVSAKEEFALFSSKPTAKLTEVELWKWVIPNDQGNLLSYPG